MIYVSEVLKKLAAIFGLVRNEKRCGKFCMFYVDFFPIYPDMFTIKSKTKNPEVTKYPKRQ